ncbi:MAG TPA: hypothetical protein VGE02_02745 [Gemmatimonadales bacterium]
MLSLSAGCQLPAPAGPRLIGEGRRALFIGNSYLYTQDIPGIVQALAASTGDQLAVETVAGPDMALIDHWRSGLARAEIAKGRWEWVILQQGPSSTAINRDSLRLVTALFDADIRAVSGTTTLFSAWPSAARRADFDAAIASYTTAATAVGGKLLPVASGWLAAWARDPSVQLYVDGLHPSAEGAYLSALVVYAKLLGKTPIGLPATLRLRSGATLSIAPETAVMLQQAAGEATTTP